MSTCRLPFLGDRLPHLIDRRCSNHKRHISEFGVVEGDLQSTFVYLNGRNPYLYIPVVFHCKGIFSDPIQNLPFSLWQTNHSSIKLILLQLFTYFFYFHIQKVAQILFTWPYTTTSQSIWINCIYVYVHNSFYYWWQIEILNWYL